MTLNSEQNLNHKSDERVKNPHSGDLGLEKPVRHFKTPLDQASAEGLVKIPENAKSLDKKNHLWWKIGAVAAVGGAALGITSYALNQSTETPPSSETVDEGDNPNIGNEVIGEEPEQQEQITAQSLSEIFTLPENTSAEQRLDYIHRIMSEQGSALAIVESAPSYLEDRRSYDGEGYYLENEPVAVMDNSYYEGQFETNIANFMNLYAANRNTPSFDTVMPAGLEMIVDRAHAGSVLDEDYIDYSNDEFVLRTEEFINEYVPQGAMISDVEIVIVASMDGGWQPENQTTSMVTILFEDGSTDSFEFNMYPHPPSIYSSLETGIPFEQDYSTSDINQPGVLGFMHIERTE